MRISIIWSGDLRMPLWPLFACRDWYTWVASLKNVLFHTYIMHMHPANILIRAVWSESSLGAFWIAKDEQFLPADNTDSDQTAWIGFLTRCLIYIVIMLGHTLQNNLNGSNPDGSFTLDDSNSFFQSLQNPSYNSRKQIFRDFFLFYHGIVCCVYSLESPHRGDSNEYTQHSIIV